MFRYLVHSVLTISRSFQDHEVYRRNIHSSRRFASPPLYFIPFLDGDFSCRDQWFPLEGNLITKRRGQWQTLGAHLFRTTRSQVPHSAVYGHCAVNCRLQTRNNTEILSNTKRMAGLRQPNSLWLHEVLPFSWPRKPSCNSDFVSDTFLMYALSSVSYKRMSSFYTDTDYDKY